VTRVSATGRLFVSLGKGKNARLAVETVAPLNYDAGKYFLFHLVLLLGKVRIPAP
jgi:hypothetical protein